MKQGQSALRICLLLAVALLAGCAAQKQYRTQYDLCQNPSPQFSPDCSSHALQQWPAKDGASYVLGFIEFDDQGRLWDRKQMWSVLDWLTRKAATEDLLMVVFVHGWKHNAAPQDGNIETFRKVLAKLSEDERYISQLSGQPARQVAGIYLGWRGESVPVPVLDNVTFWDRKSTAAKVGHGEVTEVLARLDQLKRDKDSTEQGNSGTRLVVVGHSFGGLVVFSALNQILDSRFVRTTGPDGIQSNVESFGNLVVLINPAFEALQFATLSDMSVERGSYFKSQLPVMAILTSEADYATRYAFPAGRWFSTLFESTRDTERWNATSRQTETVCESSANVRAVGHFPLYQTHTLVPAADSSAEEVKDMTKDESLQADLRAAAAWENDKPGSQIPFADVLLERNQKSAGRDPYLVIRVDKHLIKSHNDISDPRVIEFLKQLVLISTVTAEHKDKLYKAMKMPAAAP